MVTTYTSNSGEGNEVIIKRALISVSDKRDIIPLCQALLKRGVEIISTGGTQKVLEKAHLPVTSVKDITGNPEAFGGRMKTLSFQVGSALLYRRDHPDEDDAQRLGIHPIDLVVCNLYPFSRHVQAQEADLNKLIESIDIGGPTMIRAAAKNFHHVGVATHPDQYSAIKEELEKKGSLSWALRQELSLAAFELTAQYDTLISEYLHQQMGPSQKLHPHFSYLGHQELRYGENSHQKAALFHSFKKGVAHAKKLQGKDLSYNNLLDTEAAWKSVGDARMAMGEKNYTAVAVIKHLNPCGLACHSDPLKALELSWDSDPVSAFGGIIATTSEINEDFVKFLDKKFIEVLIGPTITEKAKELLAKKKKNLRLLLYPNYQGDHEITTRSLSGGFLVQEEDRGLDLEYEVVTKNDSLGHNLPLCRFTTMTCKHLKSNAIALVRCMEDGGVQLVGAGMGQPNRIDSLQKLALPRMKEKNIDSNQVVMGSDAFFPFPDIIEICFQGNITKVIQPGGSIRDEEIIQEANRHHLSMIFTRRRHFRH